MVNKNENILIRVTKEEKEFIKNKSKELGFKNVSAFIIYAATNHISLNVDMKIYRDLASEINYIGKNINSLIRKINTDGIYTDSDIDFIKVNQKQILELIEKEYDRLLDPEKFLKSQKITPKKIDKIIAGLKQNDLEIPRKFVLEEVYENIKNDFLFLIDCIKNSDDQEEEISEYLFEYVYGETLFEISEKELINFSDDIFKYVQKLKFKTINLDYNFSDDDWYELKEILDEYEVF